MYLLYQSDQIGMPAYFGRPPAAATTAIKHAFRSPSVQKARASCCEALQSPFSASGTVAHQHQNTLGRRSNKVNWLSHAAWPQGGTGAANANIPGAHSAK